MTIHSDAEILDLLNKLDRVPADALETGWLDFKPWHGPKEDMKLATEYAVCFANAGGGVVVFGVTDKIVGRSAAIPPLIPPSPPFSKGGAEPTSHISLFEKGGLGGISVAIIKDAADIERVSEAIAERGFTMKIEDLRSEAWTLESPAVLALMEKLRKAGTPLGKYVQGRFYYGIKTGFNDAFVIDAATRERLIATDPSSAELIRPWLRGRDIRKWKAEWAGLYVIAIASSANRAWPWSKAKSEVEARRIFAAAYPAIHTHLSQWEAQLRKRDDQGQYWWELRSCAYYAEFEQPKIVYADIAKFFRASWDEANSFLGNTCYFIPTEDKFLFGVLRSTLLDYYFRRNFQVLGDAFAGGRIRFFTQDMEQLPIAYSTPKQKSPITQRVQAILAEPSGPHVPRLEAEIDELVFDLYNLTAAERALVLAARAEPCEDETADESYDDTQTASAT